VPIPDHCSCRSSSQPVEDVCAPVTDHLQCLSGALGPVCTPSDPCLDWTLAQCKILYHTSAKNKDLKSGADALTEHIQMTRRGQSQTHARCISSRISKVTARLSPLNHLPSYVPSCPAPSARSQALHNLYVPSYPAPSARSQAIAPAVAVAPGDRSPTQWEMPPLPRRNLLRK
jgi:hypothetical protein